MKWLVTGACIFTIVLFCSCGNKPQGKILSTEKMQFVLWDILQADAFTQNFVKKDSTKKDQLENAALQKKIFELHKISREDFYTSYKYYSGQPGVIKKILDSITARAEKDRGKLMQDRYGDQKPKIDSAL